jgi:pyrroline-5-carboxylate reductase
MEKLGFIGAGNMAGAIINGLLNSGFEAERLVICDRNEDKLNSFAERGCSTTQSIETVFTTADAVVLAVKPQVLKQVISPFAAVAQAHKPLILSVVAAIPETSINQWLGGNLAMVRTMPNTPSLVMEGATGLFANSLVTPEQKTFAESIFSGIGQYSWVETEDLLHAVTAAAGSAPAYFFRFAEAMSNTAMSQGLTEAQARTLIGQTMLGAAKMMMETDENIGQMCKNVCSPNGTTERAIMSFNNENIDTLVDNAMKACFDRSIELSEQLAD